MEIDQQLEQRTNIKFLVKLGKNGPEIHQMLQQVYGECAPKERTVFKWVQHFQEGREDPKDDARSGRPSSSSGNENIDRVRSLPNCWDWDVKECIQKLRNLVSRSYIHKD
jgi:transposase